MRLLSLASFASLVSFAAFAQVACSSSSSGGGGGTDTSDGGGVDEAGIADGSAFTLDASACSSVPADTTATMRTACTFKAGAKVADSLGLDGKTRAALPISHVVIVLKENRSFDEIFGALKLARPDVDGLDAPFTNPDKNGTPVSSFHQTTTCPKEDPAHQWDNEHAAWNNGKMDGFVTNAAANTTINGVAATSDGTYVMGTFDRSQLPFYTSWRTRSRSRTTTTATRLRAQRRTARSCCPAAHTASRTPAPICSPRTRRSSWTCWMPRASRGAHTRMRASHSTALCFPPGIAPTRASSA